jgi:hypothetical protein
MSKRHSKPTCIECKVDLVVNCETIRDKNKTKQLNVDLQLFILKFILYFISLFVLNIFAPHIIDYVQ